jgi:hypothetical protein
LGPLTQLNSALLLLLVGSRNQQRGWHGLKSAKEGKSTPIPPSFWPPTGGEALYFCVGWAMNDNNKKGKEGEEADPQKVDERTKDWERRLTIGDLKV